MLKLRVGMLCALLLGIVTVVAAETWPPNISPESLPFPQLYGHSEKL